MVLLYENRNRRHGHSISSLDAAGFASALREISSWPGYAPTPLRSLAGLARQTGIGAIFYKDESSRFGLGSFKALGGAYAVLRILKACIERDTGAPPSSADIMSGKFAQLTRAITVTCATDGNHGRSVAWGARLLGCRAVIYIHETVSAARAEAIAAFGAEVRRVSGNYDDAVRTADGEAKAQGWFVVSDTSYPGYLDVPRDVMFGYGVMAAEALTQIGALPTHIFVQAGVGALAGAVAAYADSVLISPMFVTAEPDRAACVHESLRAGAPRVIHGALDTIMAGLACGEISLVAWDILRDRADAAMVVSDDDARQAMRLLARGVGGDPPVVAGESAVAGLCALLAACENADFAARLKLDRDARVLVFGTEGATDPELYAKIVCCSAQQVLRGEAS